MTTADTDEEKDAVCLTCPYAFILVCCIVVFCEPTLVYCTSILSSVSWQDNGSARRRVHRPALLYAGGILFLFGQIQAVIVYLRRLPLLFTNSYSNDRSKSGWPDNAHVELVEDTHFIFNRCEF